MTKLAAVLDALARIAADPDEGRQRRAYAAQVLDRYMDSLSNVPAHDHRSRRFIRGHSGGDSLRADAQYEGWGNG